MRRKRPSASDPKRRQEKRLKLLEKINQPEKRKSTEIWQTMTMCSICHDVLKNPKTLPCVHSFCLECLVKQTENAKPPYRCGLCTAPFVTPAKSLETSPLLTDLLTSAPGLSPASFDPNDVKCQLCEGMEEAAFHCEECAQFLGAQCLNAHKRIPATKNHVLRTIDDHFAGSGGKFSPSARAARCQRHPIQEIDTYCKTCSVTVCAKCVVESHSGHQFCPLNEESIRLKGELIDMISAIASREKEAEEGRKTFAISLVKLEEARKVAGETLRREFEALHSELDHRQAEMLGTLEDEAHRVKKMMQLEKEEVEFALAEFKGYQEMGETLLAEGTNVEVAAGHSMLIIRGKTLDELGFLSEPTQNPEIRFVPKNLTQLKEAISTFGALE